MYMIFLFFILYVRGMFLIVITVIFVLFKCLSFYFKFDWCGLEDLSLEINFIFLLETKLIF